MTCKHNASSPHRKITVFCNMHPLANFASRHTMKATSPIRFLKTLTGILLITTLAACATPAEKKDDRYGVSIHALNYSAREVAYIAVEEPGHPERGGGGESVNPYGGGGGTICCFSVPAKWSPEFKVVVVYQFYPEKTYRRSEVGVPPYPNGKAGDIWLVVHPDESVEAVVSDFGPSLVEWPGSIKGYPVPSREYRLKLWSEKLGREQADLAAMKKALKGDVSDLSSEELAKLKSAIKYSQEEIKRLEGSKP
jgi:hypothetical protein